VEAEGEGEGEGDSELSKELRLSLCTPLVPLSSWMSCAALIEASPARGAPTILAVPLILFSASMVWFGASTGRDPHRSVGKSIVWKGSAWASDLMSEVASTESNESESADSESEWSESGSPENEPASPEYEPASPEAAVGRRCGGRYMRSPRMGRPMCAR
jgi:hypothetical protein